MNLHSPSMVLRSCLIGALLILSTSCFVIGPAPAFGAGTEQRAFSTPQEATDALIDALSKSDAQAAEAVLGRDGEKLLHSGDAIADQRWRQRFVSAYRQAHRLEYQSDEKAVLHVGVEDWPWPIPIQRSSATWRFDSAAGANEILDRRIGKNELNAIKVCLAIVDAQDDYAATDHDGSGLRVFARRLVSSAGMHDGLYWPAGDGEPLSPLGPLVARAVQEGYTASSDEDAAAPYHGYFYRMLTGQGGHAGDGAYDYLVDGRMLGGFAAVAYPARYGVSGVMTFIVNHAGVVYQKDLGVRTEELARSMTRFDPDSSWHPVDPVSKNRSGQRSSR